MHDNPQPASGLDFALSTHRIVALTGRDAVAFAQAQFMNDVGALAPGQWHWNGWLTPKGRVVALFALLKLDGDTVWLVLPDADADGFVAALRRFVFRAKVVIEVLAGREVSGRFAPPLEARGAALGLTDDGALELDMGGDGQPRVMRIRSGATAAASAVAEAQWACADIGHGLPRLPASQVEQWTPQQLSLDRLGAFSVKKGCYPGQEIVARTHFLGKAKRGLVLFEADSPLAVGAQVQDGDRALGPVVSAASADGRHLGLAVLPLEDGRGPFGVDGTSVREIALRAGLGR